jgi:hypothetical protein
MSNLRAPRRPFTLDEILTSAPPLIRGRATRPQNERFYAERDAHRTTLEQILGYAGMDDQGGGWIPELPQPIERQIDLESRMPEADFVPEGVTDPAERERMKDLIAAREERHVKMRRASQQWGNQVAGLVPGTSATILQWNSTADSPEPVNLQLSYTLDNRTSSGESLLDDDINVYAKIEWGGGGGQETAICDFQQGTQIRLTASYVRVSALYLPQNLPSPWPPRPIQGGAGEAGPTGPALTAVAILGRGFPGFRTSAARFTRKFQLAANSTLPFDPIPPFASAFGLAFWNNGVFPAAETIDALIELTSQSVALLSSSTYKFRITDSTPTPDNAYTVPQGTRFISLTNNQVTNLNVAISYALML